MAVVSTKVAEKVVATVINEAVGVVVETEKQIPTLPSPTSRKDRTPRRLSFATRNGSDLRAHKRMRGRMATGFQFLPLRRHGVPKVPMIGKQVVGNASMAEVECDD